MKPIIRLFFALLLAANFAHANTIESIDGRLTMGRPGEVVLTLDLASERFAHLADKAGQEADFHRQALAELVRERLHYLLRLRIDTREIAPTFVDVPAPAEGAPLPEFLTITAKWAGISSSDRMEVITQSDVPYYRLTLHVTDLRSASRERATIETNSFAKRVSALAWFRAAGDGALTGLAHLVPAGMLQLLFSVCLYFSARNRRELIFRLIVFLSIHSVALILGCCGLLQISEASARGINLVGGLLLVALAAVNCLARPLPVRLAFSLFATAGALHGLGLAPGFSDAIRPTENVFPAILGTTLGIALALLAMTGVTALFCSVRKSGDWYRPEIAVPASVVIGLSALAWTFGRA